ncbi:MAG: hypothetical protein KDB21_12140 [Acidimicrobiales bacterium]|nr:hypothetical protein [Acidimicrobiales bacterium]
MLLLIAACSGQVRVGDDASAPTATVVEQGTTATSTQIATYGYGPSEDLSVELQPDVVVVGGGPAAIIGASANGQVWTIDAAAPGARALEIGSVMLATSTAVGRVVDLRDEGDTRIVTLGPIDLTDLVREGEFTFDQAIDEAALQYRWVPEYPGAVDETEGDLLSGDDTEPRPDGDDIGEDSLGSFDSVPADGELTALGAADGVLTLPTIRLVAAAAAPAQTSESSDGLPPAKPTTFEVPVGNWKMKASASPNKLGLDINYKKGTSLKAGIGFVIHTDDLRVTSGVVVHDGQVTESGFVIDGITGFDVSISAGIGEAEAGGANSKIKVEAPIEIALPIPPGPATGGLPVTIKVTYKFIVETALTGDNSTLVGSGAYTLSGPIGVQGGRVLEPEFDVDRSIIDSLEGISIGPSGIVVAVNIKLMVGFGTPAASFGPYGTFTAAMGVTYGSALGSPLTVCRGASLDLKVGGGIGLSVSPTVSEALKLLLPDKTKIESAIETSTTVLHREQVIPDVPLCDE